jgi:hypothetical protein
MSTAHQDAAVFGATGCILQPGDDGVSYIRCTTPLGEYPGSIVEVLRANALKRPEQVLFRERDHRGLVGEVTYGEAWKTAQAIAWALHGLGGRHERPVALVAENSIRVALIIIACHVADVPVAPISPAYSRLSQDHVKLRYVLDLLRPSVIVFDHGIDHAAALGRLQWREARLVVLEEPPPHAVTWSDLISASSHAPPAALASEASGQRGHFISARAIVLPPAAPFGITDCYIKPYPCCRHIQPAVEALIGLLNDENIASEQVQRVEVATYRIAAEHADTGWDDFASAQLSFPYLMGLALKFRAIKFEHFSEPMRRDPAFAAIARKLTVTAPADVDRLYPQLRPARVTVTTARGRFTRQADEALGSRIVPLDDAGLKAKFFDLVGPVLGAERAKELAEQLWSLDKVSDVAPLVESMAKPA